MFQAWSPPFVVFHQIFPTALGSKIEVSTLGYLGGLYKTYKLSQKRDPLPWDKGSYFSFSNFSFWMNDWARL